MKLTEVDKNFQIESSIEKQGIVWIDSESGVFSVFGVLHDNDGYYRMDKSVADKVNRGVKHLNNHTSGGRICFETDSDYVAVSMEGECEKISHLSLTGSCGFDLYVDEGSGFEYFNTFKPPYDIDGSFEAVIDFNSYGNKKIMIHFPLYATVKSLCIGLDENADVKPYNPYNSKKPVVYYGSSITQGGCASRPGNNYPAIVSRHVETDFLCLGFSGSAHGEKEMAEYIAGLEMSVFVYDYDHNDACDAAILNERHYPFYEIVRKAYPDIPIIFMSAPYSKSRSHMLDKSFCVVKASYEKAKMRGDNVYFINGKEMFGKKYFECATVDGCHPNDYGFVMMADAVLGTLNSMD